MADMEMSLDEIIKKKRGPRAPAPSRLNSNPTAGRRPNVTKAKPLVDKVTDARNKIILKRRTQIADARDKLAELAKQKDVRFKLEQMRMRKESFHQTMGRNITYNRIQENRGRLPRNFSVNTKRGFTDASRLVSSRPLIVPAKINLSRQIGYTRSKPPSMRSDRVAPAYQAPLKPAKILRTVENDVFVPRPILIDDEYEPAPLPSLNRKTSLNLKIIAHNDDIQEKSSSLSRKTSERERERALPSILKKRPMAALRSDKKSQRGESPPPAPLEYRIVVSNLRSSVTGSDIQELFGDVGGLLESRLVRPGTAEVMYKSLEDAQRAVDLYHNRQLDGQPMNCLLVNPRSQSLAASGRMASSSKPSIPASSNSSVVPDIDTFHKVLFSRH